MKKLFWIALLSGSTVFGQHRFGNDTPTGIIKTNPLGAFIGQYQFAYEHTLSNHFSVQLSLGYIDGGSESGSSSFDDKSYSYSVESSGFIAIPEVRYYFKESAPKGWYIAALARYRHKKKDLKDNSNGTDGIDQDLSRTKTIKAIGGGGVVGYQWITNSGFTIDLFSGLTFKDRSTTYDYDNNALNAADADPNYDTIGDKLFSEKYIDFKTEDSKGGAFRFGINIGYKF